MDSRLQVGSHFLTPIQMPYLQDTSLSMLCRNTHRIIHLVHSLSAPTLRGEWGRRSHTEWHEWPLAPRRMKTQNQLSSPASL